MRGMPGEQKAIVVLTSWTGDAFEQGTEELNEALAEGYRVVATSPMGGAGGGAAYPMGWACLVVLEKDES